MFACSWKTAGLVYSIVFAIALALKAVATLPDLPAGGVEIYSDIITHIVPLV